MGSFHVFSFRRDEQYALGSRLSHCCFLKMHDVLELGKGIDFFFLS